MPIDYNKIADLSAKAKQEAFEFEESLKEFRDYINTLNTRYDEGFGDGELKGKREGKIEGKIEGKLEGKLEEKLSNAKNFKNLGVSYDIISKATGLSIEEIEKL